MRHPVQHQFEGNCFHFEVGIPEAAAPVPPTTEAAASFRASRCSTRRRRASAGPARPGPVPAWRRFGTVTKQGGNPQNGPSAFKGQLATGGQWPYGRAPRRSCLTEELKLVTWSKYACTTVCILLISLMSLRVASKYLISKSWNLGTAGLRLFLGSTRCV